MKDQEFKKWLAQRYPKQTTVSNRLSNCKKVEKEYGDLDIHFDKDECIGIISDLTYTVKDERENKKPKHNIFIDGNIRTGSATLKQAINLYVLFKYDFSENQEIVNLSQSTKKLNRDLESIGKSTFIKYFYNFKNAKSKEEIFEVFLKNSEDWKESSMSTKASVGVKIFKEHNIKVVLNIILSSCGLDDVVLKRAKEIFDEEYPNNDNIKYVFIRPEIVFEEEIINTLFSDYEIKRQFPVLDYKVDWYIPELKIAIEFDEKHHKRTKREDDKRQKEIEKKLGCRFLRYSEE